MYTSGNSVGVIGGGSSVAALAQTGVASLWLLVAAVALVTVGVFLLRLVPKDEF